MHGRITLNVKPSGVDHPPRAGLLESGGPAQRAILPCARQGRPRYAVEKMEQEMPAEKFYPPTSTAGEPPDRFEVAWHRDYSGVYLTMILDDGTPGQPPRSSAVELDRSAINRLIRTLRRARDAAYGADE